MTAYELSLLAHSYLRWLILFATLAVIARSCIGWRHRHAWTLSHSQLHVALVGLADVQLTLGLCLYVFWSPFADAFLRAPAVAMKEHTLRFFGLEHPTTMLIAIVLLHVGRVRSKKATSLRGRHRTATSWTLAALLLMLSSIPWPGLPHGRPLLRDATTQNAR